MQSLPGTLSVLKKWLINQFFVWKIDNLEQLKIIDNFRYLISSIIIRIKLCILASDCRDNDAYHGIQKLF